MGRSGRVGDILQRCIAFGVCTIDLVERDALTFGEADGCAGGSAAGIVSRIWAGRLLRSRRPACLGDEAADPGGEAARATEGFDGDALLIVFGGEVAFEDGLEFADGRGNIPAGISSAPISKRSSTR